MREGCYIDLLFIEDLFLNFVNDNWDKGVVVLCELLGHVVADHFDKELLESRNELVILDNSGHFDRIFLVGLDLKPGNWWNGHKYIGIAVFGHNRLPIIIGNVEILLNDRFNGGSLHPVARSGLLGLKSSEVYNSIVVAFFEDLNCGEVLSHPQKKVGVLAKWEGKIIQNVLELVYEIT